MGEVIELKTKLSALAEEITEQDEELEKNIEQFVRMWTDLLVDTLKRKFK